MADAFPDRRVDPGSGNLLVVSNRQPYRHGHDADGEGVAVDRPAGGLTAGLDPVMQELGGTWIAWGDGDADREAVDEHGCVEVPPEDPSYTLQRVWLSEDQIDGYYYGYSNQVLWPVCHAALTEIRCEESFWPAYQEANEAFAAAILAQASAGDMVWLQDYHMGLVPGLVRGQLPDSVELFHFWHIPWPAWDTYRACPHRDVILRGLLGNDTLGFHTPRYCRNFLDCAEEALDADVDRIEGTATFRGHTTSVEALPMGVPVDRIRTLSTSPEGQRFPSRFCREHGIEGRKLALGVDRLDYIKGIPQRLRALEHLWETRPEWRGELTYVQKATESRSSIPAYREHQEEVEARVEQINDRFATEGWTPIVYTTEMLDQAELYGLYRRADLALISSLRDGMNLTAQEFAAAQTGEDGVLVLSDQAGVHELLGDQALTINPNEVEAFAATIEEALRMSEQERRERMEGIRERVASTALSSWMRTCLRAASEPRAVPRGEIREGA